MGWLCNGITIVGTAESLNVGAAPGDGTLMSATSGGTLALTNANAAKVLTINAGIVDNTTASGLSKGGTGALVLASPNTYTGATAVSEGTLTLSSSLLTSSITVGTSSVFSETSTGSIAGAATFTHDSVATSTLAGVNTYSGTTAINNGVVNIQNGSALGTTAAGSSVASGAALQTQGDVTIGDEAITLSGSGVSNTGALRNISGNNTFGGLVTLGATTRIASDSGTLTLSNPGTITGSSFSLTFAGSGNTIVNSAIGTGSGLLSKEGTGTLTLTGANTFTNTVNISAGVLNIQNSTATGTPTGGVIVTSGAALEMQGDISVGAEALALNSFGVSNGGALRNVSGNNTWGGPLTISTTTSRINSDAGTLTISGSTIAGTGVAVPSPNMIFGGSGNITVADSIATSAGTLTKDGTGILTLSGVNTYTGATTISAGTLTIGGAGKLNSGSYAPAISNSGTFNYNSSAAQTLSGVISGAGVFNQNGPGTLTLTGANTYTGSTAISSGTLRVNSPGSLATSSAIAVNGTGTLGGTGTIGGSVTVAATGNLSPGASAGTLTIGGNLDISAQAGGAGTLAYELDTLVGTNDQIAVTGTLSIGSGALGMNDFVFTNLGGLQAGTYTLITSGGITGTLDAANLTGTIGTFNCTLQITGNSVELVVVSADLYATWALAKGLDGTAGHEAEKSDDPDGDGKNNLYEFAFDGDPLSGVNDGKSVSKIATVGPDQVLTLTMPVRAGAIFAASSGDQLSALIDGLYYRIEGDVDLATFADSISEVTTEAPAIQAGLPALSSASWTYRTFRAPGTVPTVPKAFLRAKITETP